MRDPAAAVAIRTLGCKVNRTESEALAAALVSSGVSITGEDAADVIVVNTCTVTSEADAKARKAVRRALSAARRPTVVATGCLAALDPGAFGPPGARLVLAPDKERLADIVLAALAERAPTRAGTAAEASAARAFNTRVMVKVADGCDDRCAYCIVPDARGHARSLPAAAIVARVEGLEAAGTAEVVLTGVNIGRYDDGGVDLAGLVERVAATGVRRIRVSSIEPRDITDRLLGTLAGTPAVAPHLHVPLQSGSDRVLAAMGRPYDTARYAEVLAAARAALPGLAITTDLMAGFPGERDADHAETLAFVGACGFSRLHVFRYSRRPGTPAATMPDQVPATAKSQRAAELRELGRRLAESYAASRVGSDVEMLVEEAGPDGCTGTSEDYLRVRVAGEDAAPGALVSVRITAVTGTDVRGDLKPRRAASPESRC